MLLELFFPTSRVLKSWKFMGCNILSGDKGSWTDVDKHVTLHVEYSFFRRFSSSRFRPHIRLVVVVVLSRHFSLTKNEYDFFFVPKKSPWFIIIGENKKEMSIKSRRECFSLNSLSLSLAHSSVFRLVNICSYFFSANSLEVCRTMVFFRNFKRSLHETN